MEAKKVCEAIAIFVGKTILKGDKERSFYRDNAEGFKGYASETLNALPRMASVIWKVHERLREFCDWPSLYPDSPFHIIEDVISHQFDSINSTPSYKKWLATKYRRAFGEDFSFEEVNNLLKKKFPTKYGIIVQWLKKDWCMSVDGKKFY